MKEWILTVCASAAVQDAFGRRVTQGGRPLRMNRLQQVLVRTQGFPGFGARPSEKGEDLGVAMPGRARVDFGIPFHQAYCRSRLTHGPDKPP